MVTTPQPSPRHIRRELGAIWLIDELLNLPTPNVFCIGKFQKRNLVATVRPLQAGLPEKSLTARELFGFIRDRTVAAGAHHQTAQQSEFMG